MRQPDTPLQILIAALPAEALRAALIAVLTAGDDEAPKAGPEANHVTAATPASLAPPPAKRKPGWPKGRRRKTGPDAAMLAARRDRAATAARAKRAAARAAKNAKAGKSNGYGKPASGTNGKSSPELTPAAALWRHAMTLQPRTPWKIVSRSCGTNEAQSLDAYRRGDLPPGVAVTEIEAFLAIPAG